MRLTSFAFLKKISQQMMGLGSLLRRCRLWVLVNDATSQFVCWATLQHECESALRHKITLIYVEGTRNWKKMSSHCCTPSISCSRYVLLDYETVTWPSIYHRIELKTYPTICQCFAVHRVFIGSRPSQQSNCIKYREKCTIITRRTCTLQKKLFPDK